MGKNTDIPSKERVLPSFQAPFVDTTTSISNETSFFSEITYTNTFSIKSELTIPLSVLNQELSGLEGIVYYLKHYKQLRFCEIARLLNRDDRTIWDAFDSAQKKLTYDFEVEESPIHIPVSLFQERELSVLELIAEHMRFHLNLKNCHIAAFLNKNDRTIWTVLHRAKKKRKKQSEA